MLIRKIDSDYQGKQCDFAAAADVSAVLVNHFVKGHRAVSGKVCKFLGVEKIEIVRYRKIQ